MGEKKPYYVVQSVDRALLVLELFIQERTPLGISEVASRLGLHKSVVHRLMATLETHGYLKKNNETDKYAVGSKAIELGSVFTNSTDLVEEGRRLLPELVDETGLRTQLSVLESRSVLYLLSMEKDKARNMYGPIGQRLPVHLTALGKSLLAWLPEEQVDRIMKDYEFERRTEKSIGSLEQFKLELEKVRETGYSIDNEENVLGMRCIGAPVRDYTGYVVAGISVSGTIKMITRENERDLGQTVIRFANELSRRLGYSG